jgi:hypothetical protein
MLWPNRTMADSNYRLTFPCPKCDGTLTMHVEQGTGKCPLCNSPIKVKLSVQAVQPVATEPKLGWDKRAFRRPTDTTKPMWQPVHPSAE